MRRTLHRQRKLNGFSFPELCVAVAVTVLFGTAIFATNSRLLIALKSQKETTAATMVRQTAVVALGPSEQIQAAVFDIQRELPGNMAAEVGYVGSKSNQPKPGM